MAEKLLFFLWLFFPIWYSNVSLMFQCSSFNKVSFMQAEGLPIPCPVFQLIFFFCCSVHAFVILSQRSGIICVWKLLFLCFRSKGVAYSAFCWFRGMEIEVWTPTQLFLLGAYKYLQEEKVSYSAVKLNIYHSNSAGK